MDNVETAITDYLRAQGVVAFWVDSAITRIRQGLSTNAYFTVALIVQHVTVVKGYATLYTATIRVALPDTMKRKTMRLTYTFNPTREQAHSLTVKPVGVRATASV